MAEAKQYANEILDLQSIQVFRGLSYIATAKCAINIILRPSLNVRIFADTSGQSIQMVSHFCLYCGLFSFSAIFKGGP